MVQSMEVHSVSNMSNMYDKAILQKKLALGR